VFGLARLAPGAGWDGTAGSAGIPTEPGIVGTGFTEQIIAGFDEPPVMYLTADTDVTVVADHGENTGWIDRIDFLLEGSRISVAVTDQAVSPRTGAIGYILTLDYASWPMDGDAYLYAIAYPVNGRPRLIGPIQITKLAARPTRYLSPTGSDTNDGLTSGTPWKTFLKAYRNAPNGARCMCATGTYLDDALDSTQNHNTRAISFEPASGVLGDVIVSRTARGTPELRYRVTADRVIYSKIQFDANKLGTIVGNSVPTGQRIPPTYVYSQCHIADPFGTSGPPDPGGGYWSNQFHQAWLDSNGGQFNALLESTYENYVTTGWRLARNTLLHCSQDSVFFVGGAAGTVAINNDAFKEGQFQERRHKESMLTVSSASYDAVSDRTTIVWQGSPTIDDIKKGVASNVGGHLHVWDGPLAGQDFDVYNQIPASFTTIVNGNASTIGVGSTGWVLVIGHSDALQVGIGSRPRNIIVQRHRAHGDNFQLWFLQPGENTGAGTVSTVGVDGTCQDSGGVPKAHTLQVDDFVMLSGGAQDSAYRRVVAVPSATTFTLDAAFASNVTLNPWHRAQTVKDMAVQCSTFAPFAAGSNQGQWIHGHIHIVVRQVTLHNRNWLCRKSGAGFGMRRVLTRDSVFASGSGGGLGNGLEDPSDHIIDNTHWEQAASGATTVTWGTNASQGAVTLDATERISAGVTRTMVPKIKWDRDGNPIPTDGTAKIGAVSV
jgi:hypothetical protein